jgi:hypothetical protein
MHKVVMHCARPMLTTPLEPHQTPPNLTKPHLQGTLLPHEVPEGDPVGGSYKGGIL